MTFCGITTDTGLSWRDFTPVLPGISWKKLSVTGPENTPERFAQLKNDPNCQNMGWTEDSEYEKLWVNSFNDKSYSPDPLWLIRLKCLGIAIITPTHHLYTGVKRMCIAAARIFSGYYIRKHEASNEHIVKDIYEVISTPLYIVAITASALIGVIFPLNGRMLTNSFETMWLVTTGQIEKKRLGIVGHETAQWAPCFTPYGKGYLTKEQWNAKYLTTNTSKDQQSDDEPTNLLSSEKSEGQSTATDNRRSHGLSNRTESMFGFSVYFGKYKI